MGCLIAGETLDGLEGTISELKFAGEAALEQPDVADKIHQVVYQIVVVAQQKHVSLQIRMRRDFQHFQVENMSLRGNEE